jgi:hypothetical protein
VAAAEADRARSDGDTEDDSSDAEEKKKKPKPKRLEWQEQRTWVDGRAADVAIEGPACAHYFSRKLHTRTPRTAAIGFRGGVAAKVWLNGKLVADFAPEPEKKVATKPEEKDEQEEDLPPFLRRPPPRDEPRELRIGLRAGDNHLVVKLVGKAPEQKQRGKDDADSAIDNDADMTPSASRRRGGGTSFTFQIEAEGDDVLDYETLLAVQARVADKTPPSAAEAATTASETSEKKSQKKKSDDQRRAIEGETQ